MPLVVAMDGDLILGDEDVSEGRFAANPRADGGVEIEADDDALAGYVAVGPALDPDDLTASGSRGGNRPSSGPSPTPGSGSDSGSGSGSGLDAGGGTGGTEDPCADLAGDADNPDSDGLSNDDEALLGTDPCDQDSDGDGLFGGVEVSETGTDPLDPDDPGAPLDPPAPDPAADPNADPDGDGLTNDDEAKVGTLPDAFDSDNDTLSDGEEINTLGTSPLSNDTDGDGLHDNDEIAAGTDPNDPTSKL